MRGKFNVLGALAGELRKVEKGEKIKPKEVNMDPNRLTWPYLRYGDLKKDTSYTMRLLPPHPTRNPDGFVRKEMYQIPLELDMNPRNGWAKHRNTFVMVPGCLDEEAEDPIKDIITKIYALAKGPSNFEFVKTGEDEEGNPLGHYDLKSGEDEPSPSDIFRDALENDDELATYISAISNTWVQNIMPVLLYASCTTEKNDAGYPRYSNFVPADSDTDDAILTRRFQMNDVKAFYDDKAGLVTKLREKTNDPKDKKYIQWNNAERGLNFEFMHTSGTPKSYLFTPSTEGVSALPQVIQDKLEVSEDNYPDLVGTELRNSLKSPDEMLNVFLSSPYVEKLRPFGILD